MSDTEKPTPESPQNESSEAQGSPPIGGDNVISLAQARAELLGKPRARTTPTPPRGIVNVSPTPVVVSVPRSKGREVVPPVTLPPGEHSAVIVTDTPAARAHIDKKTVHPGEQPIQTHEKKVRVKTSLDPRRAKTQLTDRKPMDTPPSPNVATGRDSGAPGERWETPSQNPPAVEAGSGPNRASPTFARPRPIPRERPTSPLFLIGVALAAAAGAVVVFSLSRQRPETPAVPSGTAQVATTASVPVRTGVPGDTGSANVVATGTAAVPAATVTEVPSGSAAVGSGGVPTATVPAGTGGVPGTAKTSSSTVPKPSSAPSSTASAKPSASSILPFGKEEP